MKGRKNEPERVGVDFEVWPEAIELGRLFAQEGYELALVGGPVRDLLLGRPSHDLDFCTSATPEQFEPILRRYGKDGFWDMGRKFGTLGALRRRDDGTEVQMEVTTYRSDVYDPDSRKPEVNYGDSLEGDLSRRDFTVNAMALRVPDLEFVDPFGGASDLHKQVLRTPVDPRQSFDDDPLRMMRAVRFVAQLGFHIAPETAEAMTDMVDRIDIVSAERVRDELTKLLLSERPRLGLEAFVESGLANIVFPEIPALQLEIDEHHRHKDVFEHTMIVVDRAVALETGPDGPVPGPDLTLRLAALVHDIGKPKTRRFEPGGKVSFHHHDAVGAKLTRKRLRALRFDHHLVDDVSELVDLHLRFHGYVDEPWTDSAVRRYVKDAGHLYHRLNRLTRADATTQNRRKAAMFAHAMDEMEARVTRLKEQEDIDAIRPDLNGDEIMAELGLQPGKMVGLARKHMLEYRLDNGPVDHETALAELHRWYDELNGGASDGQTDGASGDGGDNGNSNTNN
nr:CCA tRNA nucleotidyltransferase [Bifidobacterium gallicum]